MREDDKLNYGVKSKPFSIAKHGFSASLKCGTLFATIQFEWIIILHIDFVRNVIFSVIRKNLMFTVPYAVQNCSKVVPNAAKKLQTLMLIIVAIVALTIQVEKAIQTIKKYKVTVMKKLTVIFMSLLFAVVVIISCKDDNPAEPAEEQVKTLTMAHFGVDWSEGKVASTDGTVILDKPDGETIGWCPNGNGGGWGTGVWYRAFNDKIYRIGTGDLNNVTKADTTLWNNDVCDTPLINGDVWVAQCQDGYVAFKVIDAPMDSIALANNPMWEVKVEYKYSISTNF